jgi:hypothetical protein
MTKQNKPKTKSNKVTEILQQSIVGITEFATGLLLSDNKDLILSSSKILQSGIKLNLLNQLGKEIEEYRAKGSINDDWLEAESHRASLVEFLRFIDNETPDEKRFNAVKSVFLWTISKENEVEPALNYELIQIATKLNSGDIIVLKSTFTIANDPKYQEGKGLGSGFSVASSWFSIIAEHIGHNIPSLVEHHEDNLMKLKLISNRTHSDLSGFRSTKYFRLTTLGYKLCEYITKYT